jgi:hypothetical protein
MPGGLLTSSWLLSWNELGISAAIPVIPRRTSNAVAYALQLAPYTRRPTMLIVQTREGFRVGTHWTVRKRHTFGEADWTSLRLTIRRSL